MFKKFLVKLGCCLLAIVGCFSSNTSMLPKNPYNLNIPFYKKIIELFLPKKNVQETIKTSGKFVYVSGYPIGFSIDGAGAIVVEKSAVITNNGYVNPTDNVDIIIGDIIKEVNGEPVTSGETISKIVNKPENIGKEVSIKLVRNNTEFIVQAKAEFDIYANSYRLGLWVRDNAIGVGMMTYVDEFGNFGSLGHPITDIDTGAIIPVSGGRVYKCSIIGIKKGEKGAPGELKGLFLKNSNTIGCVTDNKKSGVYGKLDNFDGETFGGQKLEIALPSEVKMGSAKIISTVDGISPKEYEIEIIKNNYTSTSGDKCMVIRIVDEELLSLTGGIVQGMSGSPIVQNNKIIGCVTHVFVSDPKKGFASFITTMVQ